MIASSPIRTFTVGTWISQAQPAYAGSRALTAGRGITPRPEEFYSKQYSRLRQKGNRFVRL
jgi:hypothetical protein